ncbi:MAG: putative transposase, partial [Candidatus Saccharimonadales bacterium]
MGKTSEPAPVQFSYQEALCGAGVLFVLPFLLSQGLLKTKEIYQWTKNAYYSLESVVLTLAIMALARIKTPEQLKQCKPGEIGRIIGLDRIPEVRCIRQKIKFLSDQNKTLELNKRLLDDWLQPQDSLVLCVDGHQRIYYGEKANLPVKYISRQKLCLNATTEYWVTTLQGTPLLVTLGQLTEKLQDAIEESIIPVLKDSAAYKQQCGDNKDQPR